MSTPLLREALRKRYPMPEWVLMEEVRDAAGFSAGRSADAIAMNTWPSRGLEIHGFEIKASRADWLRELKNPAKAEAIACYCDRWWIVANQEVVEVDELPIGWGLLEFKTSGALKEVRLAPKSDDVKPLNRSFVAAMMRRVGQIDQSVIQSAIADQKKATQKYWQDWATSEADRRSRKFKEQQQFLDQISKEVGIEFGMLAWNAPKFVAALKFALKGYEVEGRYGGLLSVKEDMERCIKKINEIGLVIRGESE